MARCCTTKTRPHLSTVNSTIVGEKLYRRNMPCCRAPIAVSQRTAGPKLRFAQIHRGVFSYPRVMVREKMHSPTFRPTIISHVINVNEGSAIRKATRRTKNRGRGLYIRLLLLQDTESADLHPRIRPFKRKPVPASTWYQPSVELLNCIAC